MLRSGNSRALCRAAVVAAATLSLLVSSSPPASWAAQGNQGLQDGWAIDNDGKYSGGLHLLADGQFAFMKSAGAGWARINFRLGDGCFNDWTTPVPQEAIEGGKCHPSTLNKTAADQYVQVVRAARAQGLRVLGLLSNETVHGDQTAWTANNVENNPSRDGSNAYIQSFASTAKLLAARFAPPSERVDEWEVWNEPNAYSDHEGGTTIYTGSSFIYPSNFAQLLMQSNLAIKEVAPPDVAVISGGLFGLDGAGAAVISVAPDGTRTTIFRRGGIAPAKPTGPLAQAAGAPTSCATAIASGADYLCQTYQVGRAKAGWATAGPFDHIGQHLYIDQGGATSSAKVAQYLKDVRQMYVAFEGTATPKKTEVTEFGWNTLNTGLTQVVQAQNLKKAFGTFRSTSYVRRGFWFRTQDLPWDGYGLVAFESGDTSAPKIAFTIYQQTAVF